MHNQQAVIVIDLGYGDAGKGSLVDFLTRSYQAHTIIRFNGGAQAAHNVITPSGQHHTFAQFGSGTFIPGVRSYLSRFMLVDPYALFREEEHLRSLGVQDAFARTFIDRCAPIISPYQQIVNRLRELARHANRHGSCGMGIGETMSDVLHHPEAVLYAGDLSDQSSTVKKLRLLRDLKHGDIAEFLPELCNNKEAQAELRSFESPDLIEAATENYAYLAERIRIVDERWLTALLETEGTMIFEGAQGVLLDEWYGFAPYTSWSTATFANALTLLSDYSGSITKLGVFRTYATRHGAGPFVTEDSLLTATLPEQHNMTSAWQQAFRVGYLDLVAIRYALQVVRSIDGLAITHLDRLNQIPDWKVCQTYHSDESPHVLTSYFEHTGQTITAIKVNHPPSWAHQESLTERLWHCHPRYQAHTSILQDKSLFLAWLEHTLDLPVMLTSSGPTVCDKQTREII